MRLDTITLVLSGEISLEAFATGIARLADLVHGLAADVQSQAVRWLIDDLERSSALATVRGIGEIDQVERVVRAYEVVGSALEENRPSAATPSHDARAPWHAETGAERQLVGVRKGE